MAAAVSILLRRTPEAASAAATADCASSRSYHRQKPMAPLQLLPLQLPPQPEPPPQLRLQLLVGRTTAGEEKIASEEGVEVRGTIQSEGEIIAAMSSCGAAASLFICRIGGRNSTKTTELVETATLSVGGGGVAGWRA